MRKIRRIRVVLNQVTRDGEKEIFIVTNLPKSVANAKQIAEIYRKRWKIETMFQELEAHWNEEINTLGYPKAALFGFCVALVAYNVLAIVKATRRSAHGNETIDNELSSYYLAGNITRTYDGMIIAIESQEWAIFHNMPLYQFAEFLLRRRMWSYQNTGNTGVGQRNLLLNAKRIQINHMFLRQSFLQRNIASFSHLERADPES